MFSQNNLVKQLLSILSSWICVRCNATNPDNAEVCHVCGYKPK
jgi:ribosomal protein L40E